MRKMNKSRGMKTGKMPFGLADNKRGVTKGVVIQKVWKRKRVISQRGQPQELKERERERERELSRRIKYWLTSTNPVLNFCNKS